MPRSFAQRTIGRAASQLPGIRRLPALKLLSAAEVALLARDHVRRLTPEERRRVIALVRLGRGRRRNLSEAERDELAALIAKMDPRALAAAAAEKLSPVPLPRRGRGRAASAR